MAGLSWIKVETSLPRKPSVLALKRILNVSRHEAIGILVDVLCWADAQVETGALDGMVAEDLDCLFNHEGLGEALITIGWIEEKDGILSFNEWDKHNGESAKKRALTARRVQKCRELSRKERNKCNANGVTNLLQVRYLDKNDNSKELSSNARRRVRENTPPRANVPETMPPPLPKLGI